MTEIITNIRASFSGKPLAFVLILLSLVIFNFEELHAQPEPCDSTAQNILDNANRDRLADPYFHIYVSWQQAARQLKVELDQQKSRYDSLFIQVTMKDSLLGEYQAEIASGQRTIDSLLRVIAQLKVRMDSDANKRKQLGSTDTDCEPVIINESYLTNAAGERISGTITTRLCDGTITTKSWFRECCNGNKTPSKRKLIPRDSTLAPEHAVGAGALYRFSQMQDAGVSAQWESRFPISPRFAAVGIARVNYLFTHTDLGEGIFEGRDWTRRQQYLNPQGAILFEGKVIGELQNSSGLYLAAGPVMETYIPTKHDFADGSFFHESQKVGGGFEGRIRGQFGRVGLNVGVQVVAPYNTSAVSSPETGLSYWRDQGPNGGGPVRKIDVVYNAQLTINLSK